MGFAQTGQCGGGGSGHMDAFDAKVLRTLIQGRPLFPLDPDFRESYRAMAGSPGVSKGTVRYRMRRFHEMGLIGDWRCYVNRRVWGGGQVCVVLDGPSRGPRGGLLGQ